MRSNEAFRNLKKILGSLYSEREAIHVSKILLEDMFGMYFIGLDELMDQDQIKRYDNAVNRLTDGEPVQYITGVADFFGLKFKVNKYVLIPRPETEELVDLILKKHDNIKIKVLDMGTGSGCIPISLAKNRPNWEISGVDISDEALNVASQNANDLQTKVDFFAMDILNEEVWPKDALLDIIVSNPPYIPIVEQNLMSSNVLSFEPHLALFVEDDDPLIFYKKILNFSEKHLKLGGWLYFECNEYAGKEMNQILKDINWIESSELLKDFQNKLRIIKIRKNKF